MPIWLPIQGCRSVFDLSNQLILEIKFGEGGDDSKLFVNDLAAAYARYAASHKFDCEILASGYGHATLKIVGKGVWKAFQHESGNHVVQRVPPTESKGRRQTSYVSVAVLSLPPENTLKPLPESDLIIEAVNLGGKGGQHSNRTLSGIRMTHNPTHLQAVINGRDQHSNKREARIILTARVNEFWNSEAEDKYSKQRRNIMGGGGRGEKIRTYNYIKGFAKDHRTGKKNNVKNVIEKGRFELIN